MKKKLIIAAVILTPILGFVYHILNSTGFFKTIENQMNGKIIATISIAGVENITVDEDDDFAIFISYDKAAERDGKPDKNGIYFLDLNTDTLKPKLLSQRTLKPHGISLIQLDSNHHKLFLISHDEGEIIEIFDLYHRDSLVHEKTLEHELIFSPNDIVAISENEFYFTNDRFYDSKI